MNRSELATQALSNATHSDSFANYPAIFEGFMGKGLPAQDIEPRVNVFTYNAWRALGRQVRKGEHGIKIITWIVVDPKDNGDGTATDGYRKPHSTTVFHVSQTEALS